MSESYVSIVEEHSSQKTASNHSAHWSAENVTEIIQTTDVKIVGRFRASTGIWHPM